jgi:hypothetical protein
MFIDNNVSIDSDINDFFDNLDSNSNSNNNFNIEDLINQAFDNVEME